MLDSVQIDVTLCFLSCFLSCVLLGVFYCVLSRVISSVFSSVFSSVLLPRWSGMVDFVQSDVTLSFGCLQPTANGVN